jgi:type 1 glutamine amidotransferase
MKRFIVLVQYLILIGCLVKGQDFTRKEMQILLTYGGHDFEHELFFEMFDNLPGIKYTSVLMPDSAHLLKPGLEKMYDVIVMYDMVPSISEEQRMQFIQLLKQGIGIVALHHNLGAHPEWDEYPEIIGGKYIFDPWITGGKEYRASTFSHDQLIQVKVTDPNHPITRGIDDFHIEDETYKHYYTSPDAHVILTTTHPESDSEIAWVNQYENSPVFYLLLGHDSNAWKNPVFPKLLLNGIHWAGRNSGKK